MSCFCICHVAPCRGACRLAELNPNVRVLVHAGALAAVGSQCATLWNSTALSCASGRAKHYHAAQAMLRL